MLQHDNHFLARDGVMYSLRLYFLQRSSAVGLQSRVGGNGDF